MMYWKIKVNYSIIKCCGKRISHYNNNQEGTQIKILGEQTYGRQIIVSNNRWD